MSQQQPEENYRQKLEQLLVQVEKVEAQAEAINVSEDDEGYEFWEMTKDKLTKARVWLTAAINPEVLDPENYQEEDED